MVIFKIGLHSWIVYQWPSSCLASPRTQWLLSPRNCKPHDKGQKKQAQTETESPQPHWGVAGVRPHPQTEATETSCPQQHQAHSVGKGGAFTAGPLFATSLLSRPPPTFTASIFLSVAVQTSVISGDALSISQASQVDSEDQPSPRWLEMKKLVFYKTFTISTSPGSIGL